MKPFCLSLLSVLLFSSFASGQTMPSHIQRKDSAVVYRSARLLRMTATATSRTDVLFTDEIIVSEKIVTYHFFIRSGDMEYISRYTPDDHEQPGNLPHAWWQGNAVVGIRVVNHTLYIKLPGVDEVPTSIVSETTLPRSS